MAQTMTPAQQAKADAADAKAQTDAPPDPWREELHTILGGVLGVLRHLVAVTPGASNRAEQDVLDMWDSLANLKAGGKPPEA